MAVIIRSLRAEDAPQLAVIERSLFGDPWSEQAFCDAATHDYCLYLVACEGEKVIGLCGLTESFQEGGIDNVFVAKAYQGQGIGRALLAELLRQGEERGITAFTLEVRVSNQAAICLYESFGFASVGIRPGFYEKPKEDAHIMWRYSTPTITT